MLRCLHRPLLHVVLLVVALVASSALLSPRADAMTLSQRERIIHVAASKRGAPYRWGAVGPRSFDCSGFTRWVFAHVGRHLPRTSREQAAYAHPVRRSHRRIGDLVFFRSHGRVYHVAIYAGHNMVWHSPRPGRRVGKERLWTSSVTYGRVG